MFGLGILTISTSGAQGQREDTSGQAIKEAMESQGYQVVRYEIVSDDKDVIAGRMSDWADAGEIDLIVSTGGTGLGRRDVTPEACLSILDKEVPGTGGGDARQHAAVHSHGYVEPLRGGNQRQNLDYYTARQPQRRERVPGRGCPGFYPMPWSC